MSFDDIIAIQPKDERFLTILWQVNNWCNFKCTYCNTFSNGGDYKNNNKVDKSLEVFEDLITTYQLKGINKFFLKITGGEPSMWNGTIPVIKKFNSLVSKQNSRVSINTNLSRDISWWEENYNLFDVVIGSYHSEFTDLNQYLKVTQFLQDKVHLKTKIMMNKDSFEECINVAERVKQLCNNYRIEYTPVLAELTSKVDPYYYEKQEHLDFFKTNSNENKISTAKEKDKFKMVKVTSNNKKSHVTDNQLVVERKNTFLDWTCNIYENLFISRDGDIKQSTCGLGKTIGNIFEGLTDNTLIPITCKKTWCHCGVDIMNSKHKKEDQYDRI